MSLCPIIFGVNLTIITVQDCKVDKTSSSQKLDRLNVNMYKKGQDEIILLWTFNGYLILYDVDFMNRIYYIKVPKKYIEEEIEVDNYGEELDKFKVVKGTSCKICKGKTVTILFVKYQNKTICKECLQNYFNLVFLRRIRYFIKENLRNRECKYCYLF